MRSYTATYQDKRGTEAIVIKSDGSQLETTIRGINVDGSDFDQLTADKIDTTKFDYNMFADGAGDITNFQLTIIIPIQFYNSLSNQTFTENLKAHIVVGEHTTIDGLDHELNGLTLKTSFGEFGVAQKLEWMEDALIMLQDQLPENIYLKTCLSCKYSNYHPVGNGMFGSLCCFKNHKEELEQVHDKYDLMDVWSHDKVQNQSLFFIQETFDCPEHQLPTEEDWYYKSWKKLMVKNKEIEHLERSLFYKELNSLLRNQFAAIVKNITPQYEQLLKKRQFKHPLPMMCRYEYASWGGNRQWRLELDFDEYQWSNETVKPHFLNAFVSIDVTKEFVHFKHQLCSSFNEKLLPMEVEKTSIKLLDETNWVSKKTEEIKKFLEDLPQRFIQEIEKIDFDELEFVEDLEEVYQIISLHKSNDTEKFYARTQLFLLEVIQVMDMHIHEYEKIILEYTRKMYAGETPICNKTLKSFRIIVAKKKYSEQDITDKRANVLSAMNGFLTPFEAYNENDKIERPNDLDYKIDDLMQAGLEKKQLIPLIEKHFPEIYKE